MTHPGAVRRTVGMISLLQGNTLGRYRVRELVGSGSSAAVSRAHDLELDREVALKILSTFRAGQREAVERIR